MIRYDYTRRLTYLPGGGVQVAAGPWPVSGVGTSPGTTNLISWWSFDETSGNRADSHGSNTLTDVNTVGYTTGKKSNAANIVDANNEYLSVNSNTGLRIDGHQAATFAGWFYLPTVPDAQGTFVFSKWEGGTTEYLLSAGNDDGISFIVCSSSNNANQTAVIDTLTDIEGQWIFFAAWHDPTNDVIGLRVNSRTPVTTAYAHGVFAEAAALQFGRLQSGYSESSNVYLDEICLYKRVLSSDELDWLYNSGNGRAYSEL